MNTTRRRLMQGAAATLALPPAAASAQQKQSSAPGRAELMDMINGLRWSQMLAVVAKLAIADRLTGGPKSVGRLAEETKCHEDSLYRVLRALAGRGVFAEEEGKRFRLTPAAEALRSDVPSSLRRTAQVMGENWYWNSWGALAHSVATGETGFDQVFGKSTWDWFAEHPESGSLFNAYQSEITVASTEDVMGSYDFTSCRVVADIGGGEGLLLSSILESNPRARGILFDLPHTIADARKRLPPQVTARLELVPGDFFRAVPAGADLYVLKSIIHDWSDAKAREILASCRRAMSERAALLLVDQVICGRNQPCDAKHGDVAMMVRTGGRNRTEAEYRALLAEAGLDLRRVGFTGRGLGLLTAAPRL